MSERQKKLGELIALGDAFLAKQKIPDSRVACELLAARLLKCGRLELYRFLDAVPEERLVDALRRGLQRVAKGEPVQYVLGQWDFRKLTLKVDRRALPARTPATASRTAPAASSAACSERGPMEVSASTAASPRTGTWP